MSSFPVSSLGSARWSYCSSRVTTAGWLDDGRSPATHGGRVPGSVRLRAARQCRDLQSHALLLVCVGRADRLAVAPAPRAGRRRAAHRMGDLPAADLALDRRAQPAPGPGVLLRALLAAGRLGVAADRELRGHL